MADASTDLACSLHGAPTPLKHEALCADQRDVRMSRLPQTLPELGRRPGEAGFAVPTVTLMLLAAMAIAGVAVTASIGGQSGVARDQKTKSALQVAESGIEQALLRYNRYGLVPDGAPCAPVGGTEVDADGWCPEVTTAVDGTPVSYRVRPASTAMPSGETAWTQVEVVSTGTLSGVTRRVDFTANSSAGQKFFSKSAVKSQDGITLDSNAQVHAGAATNGDLTIESNARQCGVATVGIGKEKKGEGEYASDVECNTPGGEPEEEEIDLPPVNQENFATENDNERLFTKDRISAKGSTKNAACFDGHNGAGQPDSSCEERQLLIGSNASVTLGGYVYSFCRLVLSSNSSLYITSDHDVRIYFDSPEACGYSGEAEPVMQLELLQNTRISTESGEAAGVSLFFVGSQNIATKILLKSETSFEDKVLCDQNFVIYAPYTDVELDSNTSFCGAVAAKSVHLNSNAEISTGSGVEGWYLPLVAPHYVNTRFVECTAAPAAGAPDEGC